MSQTWINMLQMIPGISRAKAEHFATHYPSPCHLLEALHDPSLSQEEKIYLLQEKLSNQEKKIKCRKLSQLLYLVFTSQDPSTSLLL
jgi:hypothetical protein